MLKVGTAAAGEVEWKVLQDRVVPLLLGGDFKQAERYGREALAEAEKTFGANHLNTASSRSSLALVLHYEEREAESEQLYRQALAVRARQQGMLHPATALLLLNLADVVQAQGRLPEAEKLQMYREHDLEYCVGLARHALKVEVKRIVSTDLDVPNTILSYAADSGADLIVMGGFGHSRLREFVLGGATRGLLLLEIIHLVNAPGVELPPLEVSFLDHARSLASFRDTDTWARSRDYWMDRLPTLPPPLAPPDDPLLPPPPAMTRLSTAPLPHVIVNVPLVVKVWTLKLPSVVIVPPVALMKLHGAIVTVTV